MKKYFKLCGLYIKKTWYCIRKIAEKVLEIQEQIDKIKGVK